MSVTATVQHYVKDYDTWHKAYARFPDAQKAGGVTHESVHRAIDDPNNVLVIHGFGTLAEAETFLNGAQLRDTMQQAGVEGRPRIEIYQDA
jgi:hypothetical protein